MMLKLPLSTSAIELDRPAAVPAMSGRQFTAPATERGVWMPAASLSSIRGISRPARVTPQAAYAHPAGQPGTASRPSHINQAHGSPDCAEVRLIHAQMVVEDHGSHGQECEEAALHERVHERVADEKARPEQLAVAGDPVLGLAVT